MCFTDYESDYWIHSCRNDTGNGSVFKSFAFIGNGFMAIRNILYTSEGGDMTLTVAVDIVLIIVSSVVGYFSFKRMDILKRSDWRM